MRPPEFTGGNVVVSHSLSTARRKPVAASSSPVSVTTGSTDGSAASPRPSRPASARCRITLWWRCTRTHGTWPKRPSALSTPHGCACAMPYARFLKPACLAGNETQAIWDRQVDSFWEVSWTSGPWSDSGNLLARRKQWRSHSPPDEPGDKCTVMHDLQELSGHDRARHARQQDEFWRRVKRHLGELDPRGQRAPVRHRAREAPVPEGRARSARLEGRSFALAVDGLCRRRTLDTTRSGGHARSGARLRCGCAAVRAARCSWGLPDTVCVLGLRLRSARISKTAARTRPRSCATLCQDLRGALSADDDEAKNLRRHLGHRRMRRCRVRESVTALDGDVRRSEATFGDFQFDSAGTRVSAGCGSSRA